jgi:[ribosomal protein S5]-alanine N-acetyltransferase
MNINKKTLILDSNRIYLRPLQIEDITDEYIDGLNNPEINRYLELRYEKQTYDSVTKYVCANLKTPNNILFGVFTKNSPDSHIGTVHVSDIDLFHYIGNIGVCLFDKRVWKKGYAVEGISLVKDYLFESLGLHFLEARVWAENENSCRVFTQAGFSETNREKNKYRYGNRFGEVIYFGIFNPSFDMLLLN